MPTLIGTTQRLELNQSSRDSLLEEFSGEKLVLWQGLSMRLECALFNDTPGSSSFVSDISNVDSVNIVVRKNGPNGNILFTEEVSAFSSITYATWLARTSAQFVFNISELDTTQIVPDSGRLPIYFVITAITNSGVPYIAGYGYGEIVDVGFIENPVASDYVVGRTSIVGGRLLTDLDANGFRVVNQPLSGVEYVETGSVVLTIGQLDVDVAFLYEKIAADYIFQPYPYIVDTSAAPEVLFPVIVEQTTLGFRCKLAAAPTSGNCTLFWGVVILDPLRQSQPGTTGPRFVNEAYANSTRILYASRNGIVLDSDVLLGGGTNVTTELNALLASFGPRGGTLVLDGAALVSGLNVPSNVRIHCLNASCGVFLADDSNRNIVTNSNFLQNGAYPLFGNRQKNISIVGGTWNGNKANQSESADNITGHGWNMGMWFSGVDNLFIDQVTILNARKFALMITYPDNPSVLNYTAKWDSYNADNNDAIHFWGPATGLVFVQNLHAINGSDDTLALNYCESGELANGSFDFTSTPAAIATIIDGVHVDKGTAVLRVDARFANVGDIFVRDVICNFYDSGSSAVTTIVEGYWNRLVLENWTVHTPAGVSAAAIKGNIINYPRAGSITEYRNWHFTGSGATEYGAFATIFCTNNNGPARKIIFDNITAEKPVGTLQGAFVAIGTPPGYLHPSITQLDIKNCDIKGYAFLVRNDLAADVVQNFSTDNSNTLNGAAPFDGARFLSISDKDELNTVAADLEVSVEQTITNNTPVALSFVALRDTSKLFNVATPTRLTAPSSGWYDLDAYIIFATNATGRRALSFRYNGTTTLKVVDFATNPGTGETTPVTLNAIRYLAEGDYVELLPNQTSGGPLNVLAGGQFVMARR